MNGNQPHSEGRVEIIHDNKLPVYEDSNIKTIEFKELYKGKKWWSAVVLQEVYGKKQVAVYLWIWDSVNVRWKRKHKFTITSKIAWENIKRAVDRFIDKLDEGVQS